MDLKQAMKGKIIKGNFNGEIISEQWINVNDALLIAEKYAHYVNNQLEPPISDDFLRELHKLTDSVDLFAVEMQHRLIKKFFEGYTGWDDPSMCEQWANDLRDQLVEDLNNGKEVDIANRAMMLYFINRRTNKQKNLRKSKNEK